MSDVQQTTKNLEITLGDIWIKINDISYDIRQKMHDYWTNYDKHSAGLFDWLNNNFDVLWQGIVSKIETATLEVEGWINETKTKVSEVYTYISTTIKNAIDWIEDEIGYFWDDVVDKFKALRSDIYSWITNVIDDVKDLSNLLIEKVKEILKSLMEFTASIMGKIEQRFWDTIQTIKDWSLQIIRNVIDRANEIKELVVEKIEETIKNIKETGEKVIRATKEFIEDLKDKLVSAWEKLGALFVDTITDFKTYLTDLLTLDENDVIAIMKLLLKAQINAEKDIIGSFKGKE